MPAYSLIIGLPHAEAAPREVICGPEVPYQDQRDIFKSEFMSARVHDRFQYVELLDSRRGVRKRKHFLTPEEAERRAAVLSAPEPPALKPKPPKPPKPTESPKPPEEKEPLLVE